MKHTHTDIFDMLYIDGSLHTSMSLRWERRERMPHTQDSHAYHSNYRILQQASTTLSTYDIKQSRSEKLPLLCDELRAHCEGTYETLQAVCVCIGPGSFTGIRSSLAFAKGLCCGNGITQLITLTSFDIIAQAYCSYRPLIALCDARGHRYVGQTFIQHTETERKKNDTHSASSIDTTDYIQERELLDIHTLHTTIQALQQSLHQQDPIVYIAGEPAAFLHTQLHEQYSRYYAMSYDTTDTASLLRLPHMHWNEIQCMHAMSIVSFRKFLHEDFSSMDSIPLYGKHYI